MFKRWATLRGIWCSVTMTKGWSYLVVRQLPDGHLPRHNSGIFQENFSSGNVQNNKIMLQSLLLPYGDCRSYKLPIQVYLVSHRCPSTIACGFAARPAAAAQEKQAKPGQRCADSHARIQASVPRGPFTSWFTTFWFLVFTSWAGQRASRFSLIFKH